MATISHDTDSEDSNSFIALCLKCVGKRPNRAMTRCSEASTLLEQIRSSGKQFLQQQQSRFASWAALFGTNWICPYCSITHPSIAAPIQLRLLATLPCTFFLERQFFGFVYILGSASVGQSSETPNAKDTPLALVDRKQAPSHPKAHLRCILPLNQLPFHRHHNIGSNFVHAVPCNSLAISTVLTTLRSRQANIGFPTTTRLHRDLLAIPTTKLFI